jgi:adenylate cyclase class 2
MAKKMENEVKVLDVDVNKVLTDIEKNNGILVKDCIQKIYTYDLGTISGRFDDLLRQFKPDNFDVMKAKFKLLFFEIDNLLTVDIKNELMDKYNHNYLNLILEETNSNLELEQLVNDQTILNIAHSFGINPNKWIRLRETDDLTTIATKNILEKKAEENRQPVLETEIDVPSISQANELLEQLGFAYRNYQEKRRITFMVNDVEVDIDFWPLIPPYMEIESTDEKIDEIINLLNLKDYEIVSCNTEDVYNKYNINIYNYRELRLDEKSKCKQSVLEHNRKM